MKKLFLLDAYALIFRAYYAMMRNPRITSTGLNTGAVMGFVLALQDVIKKEQPTHMAVCFDPPGGTFRHKEYPEYKANRDETPEDIKNAVPYIKRILKAYNIPVFEVPGFEADDVIGSIAKLAADNRFETFMMTPDKDFGQLVEQHIKMYKPARGGAEPEVLGVDEINKKYGITSPKQVIDILALMGDSVDNIPGCPGVGEVTAIKLVREFGSVENLIDNTDSLKGALKRKVSENIDKIRFSKYLATIKTDVPLEWDEDLLKRKPADMAELRQVFAELEFRTLTARIIDRAEANVGVDDNLITLQQNEQPAETTGVTDIAPSAGNGSKQLSLFDTTATVITATEQPQTLSGTDFEQHFTLVADDNQASQIIGELSKNDRMAICLVADGDEAMHARLVGLAACADTEKGNAFYFHFDAMGWMLAAISPLFDSDCKLLSNNVKRDIVALHANSIELGNDYDDTAVAHYVLFPENKHLTSDIAEQLLNYTPRRPLIDTKSKKASFAACKPEAIADWACEQAWLTLKLMPQLEKQLAQQELQHLYLDIEKPLVRVLADMEIAGARIDVAALADISKQLTARMEQLDKECHELVGHPFNTASPAQVGEILFSELNLDPKAKKTKTGQYSTTEEVLMKHVTKHPVVAKILELRGVRKLLSTYVDALPALINPRTGRIHTTYTQTVTATGRLSSVNPNLQNIPVRNDEGREIRRAFIPADGNLFFSADYSQIELRLVADFSGDKTMLDAFEHNQDIHAITAARIYHENIENVTPDQRRKAKTANFGILYGISAFGLASRLMISRSESKELIDGYFKSFPQVKEYIEQQVENARRQGFVTTKFGRRRMLPDINSRNAVVRGYSERNAVNAPIQGTAADIIKIAMVAIARQFKQQGLKSKMILQVHDELNFDVVPAELPAVERIVTSEMENAYSGNVKLTASHAAATNWLDAH